MTKKASIYCACLVPLFLAQSISAQDTDQGEQVDQPRLPYEVVVRANETTSRLRRLKINIEDDFFEKFNQLNLDDDYDILCYKYKPTGSNINRRACEPTFYIGSRAKNTGDILFDLVGRRPPPALLSHGDIKFDTAKDFEVLQKKLSEFYTSDSELYAIGEALADVKRRIEDRKNGS